MNDTGPDIKMIDLYIVLLMVCVLAPIGYFAFGITVNFWIFVLICSVGSLIIRYFHLRDGERNADEYAVTFITTTEVTLRIRAESEVEAMETAEEIPFYDAGNHPGDFVLDRVRYGGIDNIEKLD